MKNQQNLNLNKAGAANETVAKAAGQPEAPRMLTPGQWVRAVTGVSAPFGFDRMPTVFG